jgi:5S rRNA maturation endonuclease (ribonuclease M5)
MAGPQKRFLEFVEFLTVFIHELNALSQEGAAVLVEGKRDRDALVGLGYTGPVMTRALLHSPRGVAAVRKVKLAIILTDQDGEGRRLAARYADFFARRGIETSLTQRRRLKRASNGIFLHIENLARFGPEVKAINEISARI